MPAQVVRDRLQMAFHVLRHGCVAIVAAVAPLSAAIVTVIPHQVRPPDRCPARRAPAVRRSRQSTHDTPTGCKWPMWRTRRSVVTAPSASLRLTFSTICCSSALTTT